MNATVMILLSLFFVSVAGMKEKMKNLCAPIGAATIDFLIQL